MPEPPPTTLLEDAIDIPIWLEADASTSLSERTHRDRAIATGLAVDRSAARVRQWWQQIDKGGATLPGRTLERARSWANLALVLFGFLGGAGLALAAFRYDGTYPVNVVRLLALLVAPQLVLLALSLLLIPGRLPGLRFVQDALSAINPGALAAAAYRQIARRREAKVFDWASAPTAAMRRFGKWQMLFWSQMTAVAFNVAVIGTAAVLIAFTDLAFGWSTTLDVESGTASRLFGAIAAPWAGLVPEAVPDQTLVESSQFFRLEGQTNVSDSRALAGWWSFTVLTLVVYGLIPRLGFLFLAALRLRAVTRALLLHDPRVVALLDRMCAPDVETGGSPHAELTAPEHLPARGIPHGELAGAANAVIWSQAIASERAREFVRSRLGLALIDILEAGSGSLGSDRGIVQRLAGTSDPIVVLTPAWEPPLLEFIDFLGELRATIGTERPIIVIPVGEALGEITDLERENWSAAVGKSGDPHAYIEPGEA